MDETPNLENGIKCGIFIRAELKLLGELIKCFCVVPIVSMDTLWAEHIKTSPPLYSLALLKLNTLTVYKYGKLTFICMFRHILHVIHLSN